MGEAEEGGLVLLAAHTTEGEPFSREPYARGLLPAPALRYWVFVSYLLLLEGAAFIHT